jgi:hypothetical protein
LIDLDQFRSAAKRASGTAAWTAPERIWTDLGRFPAAFRDHPGIAIKPRFVIA